MKKLQASFTGGELDPRLYGRVDLAKYASGAAKLSNWLVMPYGGVTNRPGWEFVGYVGDEAYEARLVPFVATTDDTYILEFGNFYMRVYRNGVRVISPDGTPYTRITPYPAEHVFGLKFQQSNDVLTITHSEHSPQTLSRYDHADWRFLEFSTAPTVPVVTGLVATPIMGHGTIVAGENYIPKIDYYTVTAVSALDGRESLPYEVQAVLNDITLKGNLNTIEWEPQPNVGRYNVYKKKDGVFGFIGVGVELGGTTRFYLEDRNITPDTKQGLAQQSYPFVGAGEYPEASTYYQQRRVFGGAANHPNRINMSQSSDYANFNTTFPSRDSDALTFGIAATERQNIYHFISVEDLLVFTASGEWRVRGSNDAALSPSSLDAKQQSSYGILRNVPPLLVGNEIVFMQAKGRALRSIAYDFGSNKYKGENLSLLASHLFMRRSVKEMAYSQSPYSTLQLVMTDGEMLSFTYMPEQEIWAWSPHPTAGKFQSVASVPEGDEDVPYAIVLRTLNGQPRRCIERRRSREFVDRRDAFLVDCGLSYDNPTSVSAIAPDASNVLVVVAPGHGLAPGDTVDVSDVIGGRNDDGDGGFIPYGMVNGLGQVLSGQFMVGSVTGSAFSLMDRTGEYVILSTYGPYIGGGTVRKAITSIGGLDHLEGELVEGLADGALVGERGELRVTGGHVTLQFPAARVHLGLPYTADLQTLDLDIGPPVVGDPRNLTKVVARVDRTRGLLAGSSFARPLYEVRPREFEDYGTANAPISGLIDLQLVGDWRETARVVMRARTLPATVLSIAPEFEVGGNNAGQG